MKFSLVTFILFWFRIAVIAQPSADPLLNVPQKLLHKTKMDQLIFLPAGSFTAGKIAGSDSLSLLFPSNVTVTNVLISKFEVSNSEYHQFIQYIQDSVAHELLGQTLNFNGSKKIDWSQTIDWNSSQLESLMISPQDRVAGKREIDPAKIVYRFLNGTAVIAYPDTLVWTIDFPYTYNEPITKQYFSHPAFSNYPVIGISAAQAVAYCEWKTNEWNIALKEANSTLRIIVHLPSNAEWEYAATQDSQNKNDEDNNFTVFDKTQVIGYPDPAKGSDKNISNQGYRYNFGVIDDANGFRVKNYADDGCFYIAPCNAYKPDAKGFFNLHGNVAEWTATKADYLLTKENKQLAEKYLFLKQSNVVKGGHWQSIPFYLQSGADQFYAPESKHSFIGFRVAATVLQ